MTQAVSLKIQIAMLAILIAVAAAIAALTLPDAVFSARDALFQASLRDDQRNLLESLRGSAGQCSPLYNTMLDQLGFAGWRMNYSFVLGGVVVAVAGAMALLAWWLAAYLSAPIEMLARSVRRVASGERAPPPPLPTRSAEVETLAADFTSMTSALRSADDDLRLRSAAIAHDIRTPLTVLRGRLTGLREGVFSPDPGFIDGLIEQIGWIDHLVADVNALSDAGQAGVGSREALDLGQLVQACVDALRPELATAGIALETALDPGVFISANEGRMRRVILNILRNLIRYAPHAPARISVSVEAGVALVVCADEGPGWPEGDPEGLTDAFVRGEASRSRATGGSGLGLSIVRTTVNAYGGSVALTRGVSGGAVITLRLPVAG